MARITGIRIEATPWHYDSDFIDLVILVHCTDAPVMEVRKIIATDDFSSVFEVTMKRLTEEMLQHVKRQAESM